MMVWKSQLIWNVVTVFCAFCNSGVFIPFLQMKLVMAVQPIQKLHMPPPSFSALRHDPLNRKTHFLVSIVKLTNPFLWTYGCFCVPAGGFSPGDVKRMKGPNNLHRRGPTCEFFPNLVASNRSPVETTERVNNNYYDDHIVIHIEHTVLLGLLYQWICS